MSKGKWMKAEQSLKKALRKDSINAEARMVYAQWFFSPTNPDYDIDAAYACLLDAFKDYAIVDQRQRERMQRFPLDSAILLHLRAEIDSAAFERAKDINTEASYITFLDKFLFSKFRGNAIELRDEVSFLDALKVNTYQSFDLYIAKYPDSHRAAEARNRYNKLLFEDKTKDGKLKSFISFYKTYPDSPFRKVVTEQIFEISTASGELDDYLDFITNYNDSSWILKKAKDIAFHLAQQSNVNIPHQILSDSIRNVLSLEADYWVPFLKGEKFGFMNSRGEETLAAQFDGISNEYLCGNVTEDYLVTSKGVVSRSNKIIVEGVVDFVEDLGSGILMVKTDKCNRLVHKSGFKLIDDCVEDAQLVANQFVAVQTNGKWSLHAISGRKLVEQKYEAIRSEGDLIVFIKNGKSILNTIDEIIKAADKNILPEKMVFDEVRKLNTNKFLVKNGALEGVVNSDLQFEIPLDRQVLTLTSFGFTKKVLNKVTTVGLSETIDKEEFSEIKPYLNWLGLYQTKGSKLYDIKASKIIAANVDSLWFTNRLAMASRADSVNVIFGSGRRMMFHNTTKVTFVKSPDSVRYFYLEDKNKKQLYEVDSGLKKFTLEFDKIEELGYNLFLIEHKGKRGLVNIEGKTILPLEYDAVAKSSDHLVSLLKDKKFGLFDLKNQKLLKAAYERNVAFFSESILIVYKDGYYGFVDREAKPLSAFEFDEVKPWSDSSAFVRKNYRWLIYDIYTRKVTQSQIKDYQLIKDDPKEKIAIIHKENEYGVISSSKGIIIPPTFSDVLNLGTAEKPIYFTEKNVEEADLFVVIYYDENGQLIRRHIYEADEYDRIYCR